jgi:hypothetical protein
MGGLAAAVEGPYLEMNRLTWKCGEVEETVMWSEPQRKK